MKLNSWREDTCPMFNFFVFHIFLYLLHAHDTQITAAFSISDLGSSPCKSSLAVWNTFVLFFSREAEHLQYCCKLKLSWLIRMLYFSAIASRVTAIVRSHCFIWEWKTCFRFAFVLKFVKYCSNVIIYVFYMLYLKRTLFKWYIFCLM